MHRSVLNVPEKHSSLEVLFFKEMFRMFNKTNTTWFPFEMEHILYSEFHKCNEWRKEMNLANEVLDDVMNFEY